MSYHRLSIIRGYKFNMNNVHIANQLKGSDRFDHARWEKGNGDGVWLFGAIKSMVGLEKNNSGINIFNK